MADFKLTINDPKTGKSYKKDITGAEGDALLGKDINENILGEAVGFAGYEFQITGGSDYAGFPMRPGILGIARKKIYSYKGVGFSGRDRHGKTQKGLRIKTNVCGQKTYQKTAQVNLKITKHGAEELLPKKEQPA